MARMIFCNDFCQSVCMGTQGLKPLVEILQLGMSSCSAVILGVQ